MLLNTCFWWKVEYQPLTGICSISKRISYCIKWLLLRLSIGYMLGSPSCSPNIHLICLAEYCNLLGKQMIGLEEAELIQIRCNGGNQVQTVLEVEVQQQYCA